MVILKNMLLIAAQVELNFLYQSRQLNLFFSRFMFFTNSVGVIGSLRDRLQKEIVKLKKKILKKVTHMKMFRW